MQALFDDELFPLTSKIAFVEAPKSDFCQAYETWQREIHDRGGEQLLKTEVAGDLRKVLLSMQPLQSDSRAVISTNSNWTSVFGNSPIEFDGVSAVSPVIREKNWRAIVVCAVPNTIRGKGQESKGRYGGTIFELFDPVKSKERLMGMRAIFAANDGGRWVFDTVGDALPFENPDWYLAKKKQDRFTPEILAQLMKQFSIDVFNPDFYAPSGTTATVFKTVASWIHPGLSLRDTQIKIEGTASLRTE